VIGRPTHGAGRPLRLASGIVAGGVFLLLLRRIAQDWQGLPRDAFHLDTMPLLAALVVQTAGWFLVVDTWRQILPGGQRLPWRRHAQLHAYAGLAHVLPGSFWMPAGRVALYKLLGARGMDVGLAIVVEWLLLGVAGLLLYAVAAPWSGLPPSTALPLAAVMGALGVAALQPAVFARAVRAGGRLLGRPVEHEMPGGRRLTSWLAREFAVLGLSGAALFLLMRAISPAASLPVALAGWGLSIALANLLAWFPLTGLFKDGVLVVALAPLYEASGGVAVALGVVLAWRLWLTLVQLAWAGGATLVAGRLPLHAAQVGEGEAWTS
jgi:hypothetical protein